MDVLVEEAKIRPGNQARGITRRNPNLSSS
jgi:hypothetical protein